MRHVNTNRIGRRGSALAMVLPLTLVLSVLGMTLISCSLSSNRMSTHRRSGAAAFELAEAGFNHAIKTMASDLDYSGQEDTSFGGGFFRVTVSTPTSDWNKKDVVAIGRCVSLDGGYVTRSVRGRADFQSPIWDYGIIAKESITMDGTADVDSSPDAGIGNVHSNGDMTIGSNIDIEGRATAVGSLTNSGTVTGGTQSGADPVPFPTVDTDRLRADAEARGITFGDVHLTSGTHVLSGKIVGDLKTSADARIIIDGELWVTGDIDLGGQSYTGDGTLISEGTMSLSGGAGFTGAETNHLALVTLSSASDALKLTGTSSVRGGLYVPNGGTTLNGTVQINGTLATKTLDMNGTAILTRNTSFRAPRTLATAPRVTCWQEM